MRGTIYSRLAWTNIRKNRKTYLPYMVSAIGMVMMARAAWRLGVSEEDCAPRLAALLQKLGLPTRTDLPASVLAEAALRDKKRSGAEITLVLPIRRGRCILHRARVEELMHIFELGRDA